MGGDNSLFQHSQAYSGLKTKHCHEYSDMDSAGSIIPKSYRRQSHNETLGYVQCTAPDHPRVSRPNFTRQVLTYDYVGFLSLERLDPTHTPLYLTFACCVLHFLVFETTRSGVYQTPQRISRPTTTSSMRALKLVSTGTASASKSRASLPYGSNMATTMSCEVKAVRRLTWHKS